MVNRTFIALLVAVVCAGSCVACSDDDEDGAARSVLPYDDNTTVVVNPDGTTTVGETPDGSACIELADGTCIRPQDECGEDAHADVLLDSEGAVVEIICYPLEGDADIVEAEDGSVSVPSNGAVVILGDEDLDGDLTVEGNKGVIYGDSPDETVINGNVSLRGNETTLRGVRVRGNVSFDGNKAIFAYCVVEGDIILSGGENLVTNCTVYGSIRSSGNGDRIVSNFVQGELALSNPNECRDNWKFSDLDEDFALDVEEADAATALGCN